MSTDNKIEIEVHKVFISYCWTSKDHEKWVHDLASRLVSNGVDVKYDKWDLKQGQDKFDFMESMVQDETIEKVLIICEHGYKEKSDKREGGVGTEVQIITPELYGKVNQTKFIPIIAEVGEIFEEYIPTFLKTRIGINMSTFECYEEGYEELLRLIYNRPKFTKPKIGEKPSFLDEKTEISHKTMHTINSIKNSILKRPEMIPYHIKDFIPQFLDALSEFKIEYEDLIDPYDEIIFNKITDMETLRNQYIDFLETICKLKQVDIDNLIEFFENIYEYTNPQSYGRFNECQFDHYKFFIMELIIYTIAILLRNNMYEEIYIMINSPYFIKGNDTPSTIRVFYSHIRSLENRNTRLSLNKLCYAAQLMIDRSVINNTNYSNHIVDADLLLHYLTSLKLKTLDGSWFPILYVYKFNNEDKKVSLLKRLVSKHYFEKVKALFGVESIDDLRQQINQLNEEGASYMRYWDAWDSVPSIKWQIAPESIGTLV